MIRISKPFKNSARLIVLSILLNAVSFSGYAGVRPESTREVVELKSKEHQVDVVNGSSSPYMVQVWLETLQGEKKAIPAVVTPPIFRINGNSKGGVKVLPIVDSLPKDRESVYLLVFQEIPQKTENNKNSLRIAVRTKIKLIIRPQGLNKLDISEQFKKVTWRLVEHGGELLLKASNPTPFNFAITDFQYHNNGRLTSLSDSFVNITAYSDYQLVVSRDKLQDSTLIFNYAYINDFGGTSEVITKTITLEEINSE
ncbi:fimbrial biogenesis chaperone [Vibrio sp. SCSIO 43137]|uniref:fimbrial biogenesis chaperone n=1 Tax=Vibrio sp. SCSIO 43137 TaxID=3021011 RepID=UPI0023082DF0|nr:molecular chaperone [Vibrio sp. SCSIO 43137]WCE31662.1 molecular chaperone [Vibrio sp. SCSIO 43137]